MGKQVVKVTDRLAEKTASGSGKRGSSRERTSSYGANGANDLYAEPDGEALYEEKEDEWEDQGEEKQRGAADDAVKQYLKEIGSYPLLTAEQELSLAERVARGDNLARK